MTAVLLVRLLLVATSPVAAQTGVAKLPDTPMGQIVAQYLKLFNAVDEKAMRAFFAQEVAVSALVQRSADERAQIYHDMLDVNGGFDLRRVLEVGSSSITVLLHTNRNEWRRITFNFDPAAPHGLLGLGVEDADPPADPKTPAPEAPPSAMTEQEVVASLATYTDQRARLDEFSGTVLLAKDGRPILRHTYGLASVEHHLANRLDTKFNLGSVNKLFTQVAIGQLVEQGKLSFDAKLGAVLPNYPNQDAAAKGVVGIGRIR